MNKEKSIIAILSISIVALLFLGARTYYPQRTHMMRGMHGNYNTEETGDYGMHGYGMMNYGQGMMAGGMGCAFNLSKNQIETLKSLKEKYYEENLALRTELYEKNLELQELLNEGNINLSKVKSLTNEIGTINARLRYNGIESYAKARNILTEEQRDKMGAGFFRRHMN